MTSLGPVTHIVIHYSATYEDQDIGLKEIREMHLNRKPPFKREGYHFILRLNGVREVGRPLTMRGAHVGGQNKGKIGICVVGGLKRGHGVNKGFDTRTPEQIAELIKLIDELLIKYPNAEVVGHKDLAPTLCPGYDVKTWWQGVLNERVAVKKEPKGWLGKLLEKLFGGKKDGIKKPAKRLADKKDHGGNR